MSKTNINKFAAFVIFTSLVAFAQTGCSVFSRNGSAQNSEAAHAPYGPPNVTGKLESDDLKEASGIAASKCQPNVFWTHNDSGDDAFVFAIDEKGGHLGAWKVTSATNKDWEDIAAYKDKAGVCYLLIGEIGNNKLEKEEMAVYKVAEPEVNAATKNSSRKAPLQTAAAAVLIFKYPDVRHDAETLLAHPSTGDIYVLTKSRNSPAGVYKLKQTFDGAAQTAEKVAEISVPAVPNGLLTGGDISPDGKRVVLCDYFSGYELTLSENAKAFDEIWKEKPLRIDLGKRDDGEAVAYLPDGNSVIAISEKKNTPVVQSVRSIK